MYTALYMPACDENRDKDGFVTEQDAIDWVVENCLCPLCIEEGEGWGSACAAEWEVVKTEKLVQCFSIGDVLEAAGYTKVDK